MLVSTVIAMLEDGMIETEILAEHPELEPEDLAACVERAAREAAQDSSVFAVQAWFANAEGGPMLDIGLEAAAFVRPDRAKRDE